MTSSSTNNVSLLPSLCCLSANEKAFFVRRSGAILYLYSIEFIYTSSVIEKIKGKNCDGTGNQQGEEPVCIDFSNSLLLAPIQDKRHVQSASGGS